MSPEIQFFLFQNHHNSTSNQFCQVPAPVRVITFLRNIATSIFRANTSKMKKANLKLKQPKSKSIYTYLNNPSPGNLGETDPTTVTVATVTHILTMAL